VIDLSIRYLGLDLPHPFIAGASPIADTLESARRAEDGGAAAIVLRSLFEEQLVVESLSTHRAVESHMNSFAEALDYLPSPDDFVLGPDEYLTHLAKLSEALSIPVIASLNGCTPGGWLEYAKLLEGAGAAAIELNLYQVPLDPDVSSAELEERAIAMVSDVRSSVEIALAVKLSPFYTSLPNFATRLHEAGAEALILFNRFFESDIDPEELSVVHRMELSNSRELLLRLRWLAILSSRVPGPSLAVTGGVHTAADAIKAILCGATGVQIVSEILRHGSHRFGEIRAELANWMEEKEYRSLDEMRGSMNLERCPDPRAYTRANYLRLLRTWEPE
jgi:dihydroorotate dehydrogenase (fumarate)